MSTNPRPLISVLTPVYNGEAFLAECIESVLRQTYDNFEYIIVNNCSTDRTREIALEYAKRDRRIRIHDNTEFVPVIANHNIAFELISSDAKYCKVVSGDDFIFPDCLTRMVALAETYPSVGIVGTYQLSGDRVRWQGFRYPQQVFSGKALCRAVFFSKVPDFGFGSPTSLLYRADLVRKRKEFYPNPSPHSDTSACFECLVEADFGFVHEILCFERIHQATQSYASGVLNRYSSACLNDILKYGPSCLSRSEFDEVFTWMLRAYHRFLAVNYFIERRDQAFWDYHKHRLAELGYPLTRFDLYKAAIREALQACANPGETIAKLRRRRFPRETKSFLPSTGSGQVFTLV